MDFEFRSRDAIMTYFIRKLRLYRIARSIDKATLMSLDRLLTVWLLMA